KESFTRTQPLTPSPNLISFPPSLTLSRHHFLTAGQRPSYLLRTASLLRVAFLFRAVFRCLDAGPNGLRRSSSSSLLVLCVASSSLNS
ncbi:hypothetical protein PIB30_097648, partial [Stylosanthes scabra]|nr:hypothetical protein [Stylosanthes scabra]